MLACPCLAQAGAVVWSEEHNYRLRLLRVQTELFKSSRPVLQTNRTVAALMLLLL